jgi:hypothetical protein
MDIIGKILLVIFVLIPIIAFVYYVYRGYKGEPSSLPQSPKKQKPMLNANKTDPIIVVPTSTSKQMSATVVVGLLSLLGFIISEQSIWNPTRAFLLGGGCSILVRAFLPAPTFRRTVLVWLGGGFAILVVLGISFLALFVHRGGLFGLGTQEAIILILVGLPSSFFLLKKGFKIS